MRKTLLATVAAVRLLTATPTAEAQFVVIDPANLAQNILQVFEAIEEGIRTLRQIELALQAVTGTDFSISPQIQGALGEVTRFLNSEVVGIVFEELEALEAFREIYPEVF
jgi:conjugal transfer/entry exclusion protein